MKYLFNKERVAKFCQITGGEQGHHVSSRSDGGGVTGRSRASAFPLRSSLCISSQQDCDNRGGMRRSVLESWGTGTVSPGTVESLWDFPSTASVKSSSNESESRNKDQVTVLGPEGSQGRQQRPGSQRTAVPWWPEGRCALGFPTHSAGLQGLLQPSKAL